MNNVLITAEQAQQIEEALVEYRDTQMIKAPRKALSIIRAARAQAEQEPIGVFDDAGYINALSFHEEGTLVYTAFKKEQQ